MYVCMYTCIPKSRVTYGFIGRVAAVYEGPFADLSLLHEDGANRRVTGRGITIIAYRFAISRRGVSYRRAGGRVTSLR